MASKDHTRSHMNSAVRKSWRCDCGSPPFVRIWKQRVSWAFSGSRVGATSAMSSQPIPWIPATCSGATLPSSR